MEKTHSRMLGFWNIERLTSTAVISTAQYAILAAIILLAVFMRFFRLGEWSYWIDEVLTVNYALGDLSGLWTPTSFRLIRVALETFGLSDWSGRLVPALVGMITLPILYFPIRRYFGVVVALLAVGLLAISPWHLYWSQNARQYTSLLLFYTLGMFAFYHWLETERFRYLAAAGLLMILAALERMNAAFFGPVVVLYFLSLLVLPISKPAGLNRRNLIILALPVLAFAVYQIFVLGAIEDYSFWILGRVHNPLRVLLSVVYDIGLPLFLLALAGGAYLLAQRSRLGLFLILNALVPVLILVALSPFTQAFSRYVFMILPVWAVLGAVAVKEIWVQTPKHARVLALGLALVLFAEPLSQNVLYYGFQNGNRENYKDAFALVQQHKQTEDFVVSTRSEIGEYYLGHEVVDSNRIDLDGIIASGRPAWFVMDNRTHVSERLQTWIGSETQLIDFYDVYVPGRPMTMRVYYFYPEEMP